MPERQGDIPIEERVNAGQSELSDFYPTDNGEVPMDTALRKSAMRQWIYFDSKMRPSHASRRREHEYAPTINLPDYVVSNIIEIDGRKWEYHTDDKTPESRRRVFIERNQLIELDVETSLMWLSAGSGSDRYESVKSQLEKEASLDNINNQLLLQLMYERVENGESLLPYTKSRLIKEPRSE